MGLPASTSGSGKSRRKEGKRDKGRGRREEGQGKRKKGRGTREEEEGKRDSLTDLFAFWTKSAQIRPSPLLPHCSRCSGWHRRR